MKVEQLQTVLSKEYNENNAKKTAMLCVIWQELKKIKFFSLFTYASIMTFFKEHHFLLTYDSYD